MKLHYWVGKNGLRNFGDSLNEIIWSEKLPGVFNKQSNHLFLGIGTILNNKLPVAKNITVLGSGVGYGSIPEKMSEWHILSVRGPLTASALKIDPSLSITDPAVLVRNIKFLKNRPQFNFSYMPHWQNDNILFKNICCKLRINYISPLRDVRYIIDQILRSRNLITEAMHGAIVADAFRIPWVCVHDTRNPSYLPFKWRDWSSSISVPYSPNIVPEINSKLIRINNRLVEFYKNHILFDFIKGLMDNGEFLLSNEETLNYRCHQLEDLIRVLRVKPKLI